MLRIRPTTVGLSERDIDLHFTQVNLYRILRCEGYSESQIRHFYETQQQIKRAQENELEVQDSCPLGSQGAMKSDDASQSSNLYSRPANHQTPALALRSSPLSVSYPQTTVRHSSLLRVAQNAESPEYTSSLGVEPSKVTQPREIPKSHIMTYRPRSKTYSWVESEADNEELSGEALCRYPVDELASLAIGGPSTPQMSRKSRTSTPLRLPETRVLTPIALPLPAPLANSPASSQPEHQAEIPRITPTLITRGPPVTPPRRSSLAYQLMSSGSHLSSPLSSSLFLPTALPATPSPERIRQSTHTEPQYRHSYNRAPRLPIYNDHLPSTQQPQTPADLARWPILTDRDMAYTAPPGTLSRRQVISHDTSPTTRGRELRTRRTREYQRAEIAEREREQRTGSRLWVDEWAADRVGEENS